MRQRPSRVRLRSEFASVRAALLVAGSLCAAACSDTNLDGHGSSVEAIVSSGVSFRTVLGQRYVGATNNGGSTVVATATVAQAWEQFAIDDVNGGALESGDAVFIRTGSGSYFQAANG